MASKKKIKNAQSLEKSKRIKVHCYLKNMPRQHHEKSTSGKNLPPSGKKRKPSNRKNSKHT